LGFSFGRPFRSKRIEIIRSAQGEWSRDGWITPHNSYFNILYRASLVAIAIFFFLLFSVLQTTIVFLKSKSAKGILLVSATYFWLVTGFFNVTFEMPYYAVAFWSSFGFLLAYANNLKSSEVKVGK